MSQSSGERTEKASPKKKRDAREKGEVHKSTDMVSAVMIFILFGVLKAGFGGLMGAMRQFMTRSLSPIVVERARNVSVLVLRVTYLDVLKQMAPIMLPFLLIAMLGGALAHLGQTGLLLVPSKLKPDFGKLSPIQGFKRIFSSATLVEMVKSIVKIVILAYIASKYLRGGFEYFPSLVRTDVGQAFFRVMSDCLSMGVMVGLALMAFAATDALYQWWKYEKDLRMTKQEVKEEYKQTEGDPQVKSKIKQKQRQMSAMRMMKRVPEADVVITNPQHFAVALRYKEQEDRAPVVLAKGQDFLARRIKKLAYKHKVTIVENKPVARALYASCQVGDEIPPELYQAIADILIYVYKTAQKQ